MNDFVVWHYFGKIVRPLLVPYTNIDPDNILELSSRTKTFLKVLDVTLNGTIDETRSCLLDVSGFSLGSFRVSPVPMISTPKVRNNTRQVHLAPCTDSHNGFGYGRALPKQWN